MTEKRKKLERLIAEINDLASVASDFLEDDELEDVSMVCDDISDLAFEAYQISEELFGEELEGVEE